MYIRIYIYTYMPKCKYIYISTYMYICIYVYICIYIPIFAQIFQYLYLYRSFKCIYIYSCRSFNIHHDSPFETSSTRVFVRYIYLHIDICSYTSLLIYIYTCIYWYSSFRFDALFSEALFVFMCVYIYMHIFIDKYVHKYMYVHIPIYMCSHVYIVYV